jgi:outer membrane protein assembly factor BamB
MCTNFKMAFAICVIFICSAGIVSPSVSTVSDQNREVENHFQQYQFPQFMANDSFIPPRVDPVDTVVPPVVSSLDETSDMIWPMQGFDATHTGRSPYTTEKNYLQELWRYNTKSCFYGSPVIDNQGTIYFFSKDLYAIHSNGTLKWQYTPSGFGESSPAVDDNGMIYFGTAYSNSRFYALYPNGTCAWSIKTVNIKASPVISPDGTIIFPDTEAKKLVAMHPNGTKKWEFSTNHYIYSTPAVGLDGTVYVGSHDRYIYAIYPNGTLKWSYKTGGWVHGSPSIATDGTVYCGSGDGYLYAFNPDNGSIRWKLSIGSSWGSSTIGPDGILYIGVWQKQFYAIHPNGTILWSFDTSPGKVWGSTAALSADGTLYFATADYEWTGGLELFALWVNGTLKWRRPLKSEFSSPAIGADGTVYIGERRAVSDGRLRAFGYGPLRAQANGPYSGDDQTPIAFTGSVIGGLPPYSFHWDFGDGGTSSEQNPSYHYETVGRYTATFSIVDGEGNESMDTANVSVSYALPSVSIVKPVRGCTYFLNIEIPDKHPGYSPRIFGPIMVKVDAFQEPFGIDRVEFYVNGRLRHIDRVPPYQWAWITPFSGSHLLSVYAFDNSGNRSEWVGVHTFKFFSPQLIRLFLFLKYEL